MTRERHFSPFDKLVLQVDNALRTLAGPVHTTERANPAATQDNAELSALERQEAARLMRINHAGEVAAQGLYQGQALTARLTHVREQMQRAAQEENDHLQWCRERCEELGSRTSVLDPVWYAGSVAIGALAGAIGDKWSLGFVAETERQVVQHLDGHLRRLPEKDAKSRAILEQMKNDELHHGNTAVAAGGADLPGPIKYVMRKVSRIMTGASYWI